MMTRNKEELRIQAYLDNQLSVEEVIKVEEKLSIADRVSLDKEREFESALVEKLMEDSDCPEPLWTEVKLGLESRMHFNSRRKFRDFLNSRWFAAAAILVIAFSIIFIVAPESINTSPPVEILFTEEVNDISNLVKISGDLQAINESLSANDLTVTIKNLDGHSQHDIQLLGMRYHETAGQKIAQLYFSCCGRPLMVFLSPDSVNPIADYVHVVYDPETMYTVSSVIDNYRILIVGPHSPTDILDLFS